MKNSIPMKGLREKIMSDCKWKIYIVAHRKIYEQMYQGDANFNNDNYVFLNVGEQDFLENGEKYKCINQNTLNNYKELGKWWAESEGIYNIWRSGIYKNLNYIGFLHYDKEFRLVKRTLLEKNRTNITERINKYLNKHLERGHISLETHDIVWDYNQKILADVNQPNKLQGEGMNCYDYILADYNEYFHTKYTLDELLAKKKINLCSCFMIDVKTFDKMMGFFDNVVKSKRLERLDLEHCYRIQGGLAERYFGIFMALEYEKMEDISIIHRYNDGIK